MCIRDRLRLAQYQTASVFGGLPLYADGIGRVAVGAIVGLASAGLLASIAMVRPLHSGTKIRILLAAAAATPFGLLLLGAMFDNTPIELRYLSFGLPFIALLAAAAPRRGRVLLPLILVTQCAGIGGLLFAPSTMQPARAAAADAARLVGDGVVLLPRGNDGVGIVGAFGTEAPPSLNLLVVRPTDAIADQVAPYHRVVLALLGQDRDSSATIAVWHAAFATPNWRRVAIGANLEVYERTDNGE